VFTKKYPLVALGFFKFEYKTLPSSPEQLPKTVELETTDGEYKPLAPSKGAIKPLTSMRDVVPQEADGGG